MNICRVTPRKIANWAANSETNAHWIAPCLAQIAGLRRCKQCTEKLPPPQEGFSP
jgi:hypothetical protein